MFEMQQLQSTFVPMIVLVRMGVLFSVNNNDHENALQQLNRHSLAVSSCAAFQRQLASLTRVPKAVCRVKK